MREAGEKAVKVKEERRLRGQKADEGKKVIQGERGSKM